MNLISSPAKRRLSVFLKLASICTLILLLHIPLAMTRGILKDRQNYQTEATNAMAEAWGREQRVVGPVLAVPYVYRTFAARTKTVNGQTVQTDGSERIDAIAYFLPEDLEVSGEAEPEVRHRGIYESVVYTTRLKFEGRFAPDFAAAGIDAEAVDWAKARVYFGVSDLQGLRSLEVLKNEGAKIGGFESAEATAGAVLGLTAKAEGVTAGAKITFGLSATVQGSRKLEVAPVGKTSHVLLKAPWKDPSFVGAALPMRRQVDSQGFVAEWQSAHFSRGFPQSWTNRFAEPESIAKKIESAAFGVRFAQPVDGYSMTERAHKYGLLFFVLIFAAFFLFEVTGGLRIHPLQYSLVGAGLCLFFLGFLALAEFLPVGAAYAVAAGACTLMVALYAHSFLRTGWRSVVIGSGLGATYGYLYFVLQSQDYALLAGTVALFAVLALIMFCTRRINWYGVDLGERAPSGAID